MAKDHYQIVTDRILAALESGTAPWSKPYASINKRLPCNAVTNRPYNGINLLLYFISEASGYARPRFLTFNQCKNAGGHVRKGERSPADVLLWKPVENRKAVNEDDKKIFLLIRSWAVFNVDQCEGLPEKIVGPKVELTVNKDERNAAADEFIKATGAIIKHDNRHGHPCYIPSRDFIDGPKWENFHGHDQFYATMFHELIHWTGHKTRLDREGGLWRTPGYAFEELVAEIGAAFLCAEFGFDHVDQSASYIKGWVSLLKDNKRAIFTAASAAQKAVDFLRGKVLAEEETEQALEAA